MNGPVPVFEHTIEGNPDGPVLVFVHGWPDNASLWRKQVEMLGSDFRCVLVTLPNYGRQSERRGGFDFPALATRLAATIRAVQPNGRVGLVTHDWGAYLGYLVEQGHADLIAKVAALDVGGHLRPMSLKSSLMIIAYQWALVACWLTGGLIPPLGDLLSRGVARVVGVPGRQRAALRSRFNYLYFYFWRNTLLPWRRGSLLRRYRPRCPTLYLFGERKPVMFHSPEWLRIVAASGGRAEGIAGAGHWLMETHEDLVNSRLADWFGDLSTGRQNSAG
jgi:pimeloyl-ACP methyl ester carboxylesterase